MTLILNGKWAKETRLERGISIADLAKCVQIDERVLRTYEEGIDFPYPEEIDRLANFYNVGNDFSLSCDSEELIEKLRQDILEFGNQDCWLIYKHYQDFLIIFTDYQPVDEELPLQKEELEEGEMAIIVSYKKALKLFEKQDSIFS